MGKLTDWVKANTDLKENANLADFEELEGKSTFEAITTKEQAAEIIKKNAAFTSALDAAVQEAVKSHDEKFMKDKLPELIKAEREKIEAELNPEKTPEQKRIEELEKRLAEGDAEKKRNQVADKLVEKAKELGHPNPEQARRYVAFGDKAEDELKADIEYLKTSVNTGIEAEIKKRYGDATPPNRGNDTPPATRRAELIKQYNELETSSDPRRGEKMLTLKDQIAKLPKE